VVEYDLPPQMGKSTDPRASAFIEKYGKLVQVELDALPPSTLRDLYEDALSGFWDMNQFEAVRAAEREDRRTLEVA
jgi:hypothetical protein